MINEEIIQASLERSEDWGKDPLHVREILAKAKTLTGLNAEEVACLSAVTDKDLLAELFQIAAEIKEAIYGKRIVIFAPLYISNFCSNSCLYCAFRADNKELRRRALTQEEIVKETEALIQEGQKRVLLVAGETHDAQSLDYILQSIETIYATGNERDAIRRININIAPQTTTDFKRLHDAKIGTYQLFQETYHRKTYKEIHVAGKKADYDWRLTAIDRAMQAGIDDVGLGILFGLADWRFEILALMQHIQYLEQKFGVGPHTLSVPRLEPALGSSVSSNPPFPVSDQDFSKIIAILRLAVPYTGIILSTRETAELRRNALAIGISQISAGSRTDPGGYAAEKEKNSAFQAGQFSLGDHRSLDEVVRDLVTLGYLPSFCTACYRQGRTGEDFMALAKCGRIKNLCDPNALFTFQEYLLHYAKKETRELGEKLIEQKVADMPYAQKEIVTKILKEIQAGRLDSYL
ncbi:MAG: [FeFe] hydrogenase H-cluster radical SAM maturase HydG [Gammaproteobacteria bacterium]